MTSNKKSDNKDTSKLTAVTGASTTGTSFMNFKGLFGAKKANKEVGKQWNIMEITDTSQEHSCESADAANKDDSNKSFGSLCSGLKRSNSSC